MCLYVFAHVKSLRHTSQDQVKGEGPPRRPPNVLYVPIEITTDELSTFIEFINVRKVNPVSNGDRNQTNGRQDHLEDPSLFISRDLKSRSYPINIFIFYYGSRLEL